jgi:hypothetical protein
MHYWGDDWPYWGDLSKAESIIRFYGKQLAGIGGDLKEKYGSIRWYARISKPLSLHDVVKAGHVAYRWNPLHHPVLNFIDNLSKFYMPVVGLIIFEYRKLMYGLAYHRACKAFPHIRSEILMDADWEELLFKPEREFIKQLRSSCQNEED